MKFTFVCGSLERGSDGVGDYTRRMAQALLACGHEVSIVALRDQYVDVQQREIIETNHGEIKILRIPMNLSLKESALITKNELNDIKPDWISIQFVIFAFHPKGLPFGLARIFYDTFKSYKVQIMFHELWLGIDKLNSIKYSIWGFLQKRIFVSLLHKLKPLVIHTNSHWYATQLNKLSNNVKVLPLFSNIPVVSEYYNQNRSKNLLQAKSVNFVVFGHISFFAPVEKFIDELTLMAEKYKIEFSITFIGKNNSDLQRWVDAWKSNFKVTVLGIQSEYEISKCLSLSDIGISTTPYALLGKSGSFFALQDHGLPVINVSDLNELHEERKNYEAAKGLFEYKIGNLENIFETLELPNKLNQLEDSRDLFLKDLISSVN